MLANGLPRAGVIPLKPWNNQRRFWFELAVRDVVVRQRAVERILLRYESHWNIIAPRRRIGIIEAAVTACPIRVPGTLEIRHRIVSSSLFPHPKYRGYDVRFPWE